MSSKQACQIVKPKRINVPKHWSRLQKYLGKKSIIVYFFCNIAYLIFLKKYLNMFFFSCMISSLFLSNNNSETISFQAPNQKNSTKSIIKGVTCALYSVLSIISHVIAAALWEKKRKNTSHKYSVLYDWHPIPLLTESYSIVRLQKTWDFTQESNELLLWHGFIAGMVIVLSYRHFMEKSCVNIL